MEDPVPLLAHYRKRYSQQELAALLDTDVRTLRRWEVGETDPPKYLADALRQRLLPLADGVAARNAKFRFIDLFAGIGGLRMAFEGHGGQCVFTSEWNTYAQKTYLANFPESAHALTGDITCVNERDIPDHDVLLAGFPCQPFSIAGVSKKNALGRAHGFADETQGTLFFDVQRIIAAKRPAAFLLENVKNLVSHDKGNTFRVIRGVLERELGYHIHWKVLDGRNWVPQHRERILIVGFREPTDFDWQDVRIPEGAPKLGGILHPQDGSERPEGHYTEGAEAKVAARYTLTAHLWAYLKAYAAKHKAAGNGFGFGLVDENSVTRTLSARYYKDGSEILLSQGARRRPRRLTPRECARLMGFPDTFEIPVSDTQAYQLFATAAVVPMASAVAKCVIDKLDIPEAMTMDPLEFPAGAFTGKSWSREQLKLAFYFYCQTPFGQLHGKNPKVITLANLIGRTPGALAMKCVNFASIDPAIRDSGRSGLSNASKLDREIWDEFHSDWERLAVECAQLRQHLEREHGVRDTLGDDAASTEIDIADYTGETRAALVTQRVKQSFFRRAVLSSYGARCCISGVGEPRLLVASHIVPWSEDKANRLNPSNGLCLSAIHDKAFDNLLFSLTDDHRIVLSKRLECTNDAFLREVFWPAQDRPIALPERFRPEAAFVRRHRERMLGAEP